MIPFPLPPGMPLVLPRRCPVPGCPRPAANGHCMCLRCWRWVAAGVREIELATFEAWCRGTVDDQIYADAVEGAVLSCLRRRHTGDLPETPTTRPGFPMRTAARVGTKPHRARR